MHPIQIYTCVAETDIYSDSARTINRVEQQQDYLAYILKEQYNIEAVFVDDEQNIKNNLPTVFLPIISEQSVHDLAWTAKAESFLQKLNSVSQNIKIALISSDSHGLELPNIFSIYSFKKIILNEIYKAEKESETLDNLLFNLFDISKIIAIHFKLNKEHSKKVKTDIKIFLAEVSRELMLAREVIRRELISRGITVFPEEELPTDEISLEKKMHDQLKESKLSIHLIGNSSSGKYTDAGILIEDAQNKIAARYCNQDETEHSDFQRIIWMPHQLKLADKEQEVFVGQILKDRYPQSSTDIVRSSLEELKDIIENNLYHTRVHKQKKIESSKKMVYIIQKNTSDKILTKIAEVFEKHEIATQVSHRLPNAYNSLVQHRDYLLACSGVIILYKEENIAWLRSKMNDILKIKNHRKNKYDFTAIGIWEDNIDQINSIFEGVIWLNMQEDFSIDSFLASGNQA